MKKMNRSYLLGILGLLISAFIIWQTGNVKMRLVANEPGPRFIPYVSAVGLALFSILTMIFDGPKEAQKGAKPYLDKAMTLGLEMSIQDLKERGKEIFHDTMDAYNWYKNLTK